MPEEIPNEIISILKEVREEVTIGQLSLICAGERITQLNFHPALERVVRPELREVIEDLAPDLEVSNGDPRLLWSRIEKNLQIAGLG